MNAFQLNDSASDNPPTSNTSSRQIALLSGWMGRALQVLLLWAAYVRAKGAYRAWSAREATVAVPEGEQTGAAAAEAVLDVIRDPFWFEFSAALIFVGVALIVVSDLRFVSPDAKGVDNLRDIRGAMRWYLFTPIVAAFAATFFFEITLSESLSGFLFSRTIMLEFLPGWSGATLFPVIGMLIPAVVYLWSEIQMVTSRSGKPVGSGAPQALVARASGSPAVGSLGSQLSSLARGKTSASPAAPHGPNPA